jgi:hypothetical protein
MGRIGGCRKDAARTVVKNESSDISGTESLVTRQMTLPTSSATNSEPSIAPGRSGSEAYRRDECPQMWSNTHDASASAEVVVGPKICLYWSRDGPDVAGLRGCGAAAGLAGFRFLRAGVAIWAAS